MVANSKTPQPARMAASLLRWYDRHGRSLPWRKQGATHPSPYRIWLSEIMLQQTTVAAVIPYYQAFLRRWPSLSALALAEDSEVMRQWAGLGYYARARNMMRCARVVVSEHGGRFPKDEQALRALPGIGPYTAAAIAAIAFDHPAVVVDGNVERVMARLFALDKPLKQAKSELLAYATALTPKKRPGDYAQAVMDLGATICTPRTPNCPSCPWRRYCKAYAQDEVALYPRKSAKAKRPQRIGVVFWLENDNKVWLTRRPHKGLLGGMCAFPSSQWAEDISLAEALRQAPLKANWKIAPVTARHIFTHFELELSVAMAKKKNKPNLAQGEWFDVDIVADAGLPSVMQKAASIALSYR